MAAPESFPAEEWPEPFRLSTSSRGHRGAR